MALRRGWCLCPPPHVVRAEVVQVVAQIYGALDALRDACSIDALTNTFGQVDNGALGGCDGALQAQIPSFKAIGELDKDIQESCSEDRNSGACMFAETVGMGVMAEVNRAVSVSVNFANAADFCQRQGQGGALISDGAGGAVCVTVTPAPEYPENDENPAPFLKEDLIRGGINL